MRRIGIEFKLLVIMMFVFVVTGCQSERKHSRNEQVPSTTTVEGNKPFLKMEKEWDFGNIDKKSMPKKEFSVEITNTGKTPLVILRTDVACGCIKATYTEYPIKEGEKGIINVEINTTNQEGYFNKSIIVKSNASNSPGIIRIKGFIR